MNRIIFICIVLLCVSCAACGPVAPARKKAGDACIIDDLACSALPPRVCASVPKAYYQPYVCPAVGFEAGPCGQDAYGKIYARNDKDCELIKARRN